MNLRSLLLTLSLLIIGGCASHAPAPVEQRGGVAPVPTATPAPSAASEPRAGYYTVKKGDITHNASDGNIHNSASSLITLHAPVVNIFG